MLVFTVEGKRISQQEIPGLAGRVYAGPVALSHESDRLAKIGYRDLRLVVP